MPPEVPVYVMNSTSGRNVVPHATIVEEYAAIVRSLPPWPWAAVNGKAAAAAVLSEDECKAAAAVGGPMVPVQVHCNVGASEVAVVIDDDHDDGAIEISDDDE